MNSVTHTTIDDDALFRELNDLFDRMDNAYRQTADNFGFQCRGCRDNCCETRFYHHTLAEYLYLRKGLAVLSLERQVEILEIAAGVKKRHEQGDERIMCPLNHNQCCLLYAHRPMICRLHGVPHQLKRPDGQRQTGPGCADFENRCGRPRTGLLDRTPFYYALAQLERRLRQQTGIHQKIKLTVAEILTVTL
jgi:Fe-S-cluster containining protein